MAAPKAAPRPLGPCDACGARPAPFGFQPPGGARALKPGQRPWRACADPACKAQGDAKLAALKPAMPPPRPAADPAAPRPRTPRKSAAQKSLI